MWFDIPVQRASTNPSGSHGVNQITQWTISTSTSGGTVAEISTGSLSSTGVYSRSDSGLQYAFTLSGLTPSTTYDIAVSGVNFLGTAGLASPPVTLTTTSGANIPPAPLGSSEVAFVWYSLRAALLRWTYPPAWNMGSTKVFSFVAAFEDGSSHTVVFGDDIVTYFALLALTSVEVGSNSTFSVVARNSNAGGSSSSPVVLAPMVSPVLAAPSDPSNVDVIAYTANTAIISFSTPQCMNADFVSRYIVTPIYNCGAVVGNTCQSAVPQYYNGKEEGLVPTDAGPPSTPSNGNWFPDLRAVFVPTRIQNAVNEVLVTGLQPARSYNFRVQAENENAGTTFVNRGAISPVAYTLPEGE